MSKLKISQAESRMVRLSEEIEEETIGYNEVKAQYTEALEKLSRLNLMPTNIRQVWITSRRKLIR